MHLRLLYFYTYSNNIIQQYFYVSLIQFIKRKEKKARLKSIILRITDLVIVVLINV